MIIKKTKPFGIPVIISIIIHAIIFFILILVKLDTGEKAEDNISVAFVEQKKTRVLRRSLSARPIPLLKGSPQSSSAKQLTDIRFEYRASQGFQINSQYQGNFSEIKSLGHEVLQELDVKRPSVNFQQRPMVTAVKGSSPKPNQTRIGILGGYELLDDAELKSPKWEMPFAADENRVLYKFLDVIRKKIEVKKKYPVLARDSGIEGRSRVKMTILKDGRLEKVEIMVSSGNEILDNAALQSVRDATPFPPIPKESGRDKVDVSIDLVFKIGLI